MNIVPNIVLMLVWISVYGNRTSLKGYDISQILQYFLIATIISGFTSTHFEQWQAKTIRQGKIDYLLTRPFSYPTEVFLSDFGGKLVYACLSFPIFLLIFYLLSFVFPIGNLHLSIFNFLQFALLIVFGYLVEFSFALGAVFLTFWFEGADGLEHFKWITITVFSGAMIPITFMPSWLQRFVQLLPFHYMYAFPIDVIQSRANLSLFDLSYMFIFILCVFAVLKFVWHKAMYRYASGGG
jgi:ABC-2 type transport system permease protein